MAAVCILEFLFSDAELPVSSSGWDDQDVHETSTAQLAANMIECLSCRFDGFDPGSAKNEGETPGVTALGDVRLLAWADQVAGLLFLG